MAYDEELAERIRDLLADQPDLTEKRMFGGLAFLVGGAMAVSVGSGGLLVRRDPAGDADELPGARPAVMGSRQMRGWLTVDAGAATPDEVLARCVACGLAAAAHQATGSSSTP